MTIELLQAIAPRWDAPSRQGVRPARHRVLRFPGGESHVDFVREEPVGLEVIAEIAVLRGAGGDDLVAAGMWADAARRAGRKTLVVLPYIPGARQDRGAPLGAGVYARIINAMGVDRVVAFDPHSDVSPALIDRLSIVTLDRLDLWRSLGDFAGVIAPDAGARKRAELVADRLDLPVYQAMKHRDRRTGALSGFACEPLPHCGRLLVVDDICDGGGTFLGLADATGLHRERLALWVSHGVFSAGAQRLRDRYSLIATTDSHPGASAPDLADRLDARVVPVLPLLDLDGLIKEMTIR